MVSGFDTTSMANKPQPKCRTERNPLLMTLIVTETATDSRDDPQPYPLPDYDAWVIAEIGRSMASSLNQGNAVVCIASGTHRRQIEQQLKIRGIDVVGALMREQLVCLNALETLIGALSQRLAQLTERNCVRQDATRCK